MSRFLVCRLGRPPSVAGLTIVFTITAAAAAEALDVPNAQFDQGQQTPAGWTLVESGRWVDGDILEVTGSGDDSSYWRSDELRFAPGRLYRFRTRARRSSGSGTAITGPAFANRDQTDLSDAWQWIGHVFRVPDQAGAAALRLGQWHATGVIQFDAVDVSPVHAVHRQFGDVVLGDGEMIRAGTYTFLGSFAHEGSNYHRPLAAATASFNSDRWVFGSGSSVTYEFALPGHAIQSARIEVNVNYHTHGRCLVEVSRDGQAWHLVAAADQVQTATGQCPADWAPAPRLLLRVRADDQPAGFQVNRIELSGPLTGTPPDAVGETVFAQWEPSDLPLEIQSMVLREHPGTSREQLRVRVRNGSDRPVDAGLVAGPSASLPAAEELRTVAAGDEAWLEALLPVHGAGQHVVHLQLADGNKSLATGQFTVRVPDFYRTDYGQRIQGIAGSAAVWWCDATQKIARSRPVPEAVCQAVRLEAARHDREAVQVVVRPTDDLRGLTATASDLTGPGGATIPAERIRISQVYYHFVHHTTDATGVRDWWPDALPPLDGGIDVAAGQNQPLWILVDVPRDARAGDYRGVVALEAEGLSAGVPLQLHVWDFALPAENHLETAFGFSPQTVFRYHNLQTDADKRKVLDLYFQSFAEHRISPYDPTPLDPIRVQFLPQQDPPAARVDFTDFDRAMSEAVARYHFTGFRLPVQGMGGGTFHERYPPKIGEFTAQTPEYQAMFSSYVQQLESHLRDQGWLDMAYVYWFDEPAPRDFEFVADGMQRLKTCAPGLRRMLTEEPGDNVLSGLIDIWCPVSFHYDHAEAQQRRARGEIFWWYVCTGPKAPYCTLFIDHPATELRIWHWQAWQRNIVGSLVWQTNYWTSSAAFPEQPQNPYEDPMGYVSGYSTPRGVKRHWGNGDGRFLYPPLAAAVPGASGDQPVIAGPVSSIRWEMLREGVEDYEYLYLLRQLVNEQRAALDADAVRRYESLLQVPAAITVDLTTFTTDPEPIYRQRRAVAEAIEELTRR
jgi:hypothetical protein